MDFSFVHIRYFIGYVYHMCLQDTIQSTLSLCLLYQAMLLPMPLRPLLLTTRSGFNRTMNLPGSASPAARLEVMMQDPITVLQVRVGTNMGLTTMVQLFPNSIEN